MIQFCVCFAFFVCWPIREMGVLKCIKWTWAPTNLFRCQPCKNICQSIWYSTERKYRVMVRILCTWVTHACAMNAVWEHFRKIYNLKQMNKLKTKNATTKIWRFLNTDLSHNSVSKNNWSVFCKNLKHNTYHIENKIDSITLVNKENKLKWINVDTLRNPCQRITEHFYPLPHNRSIHNLGGEHLI